MFEDKTYENILALALREAPSGIDTRQGSIFYDAVAGLCFELARFYADLDQVLSLAWLGSAPGEYLDRRGAEYGVERRGAAAAVYGFLFTGACPPDGTRFSCGEEYFALGQYGGQKALIAEEPGEGANGIARGSTALPAVSAPGLTTAYFGALLKNGEDAEDDDSYRARIIARISSPTENSNAAHYKAWCEEVTGIGAARIVPLHDGANTVLARLIGPGGLPATSEAVAAVQQEIDPGSSGLGLGKANIGAYFTAEAAVAKNISVSFAAVLADGASISAIQHEAEAAIQAYFARIALDNANASGATVRMLDIGAAIYGLHGLLDYSNLRLNGQTANISISASEAPVLTGVRVSV